jgi:hypothetical protein
MRSRFRITIRRSMVAVVVIAVVLWLSATAIRVDGDAESRQIYHCWEGEASKIESWDGRKMTYGWTPNFRSEFHRAPFWPRYWRRLLGRSWPGDYVCHEVLHQEPGTTTHFAGPVYPMRYKVGEKDLFMARAKAELRRRREQGS